MGKKREYVPLREWTISDTSAMSMQTLKSYICEYISAAGYRFSVFDTNTDDGIPAIAVCSMTDSEYMQVYLYYVNNSMIMSVAGKGKYVHASDLKNLYQKAAGTAYSIHAGYQKGVSYARRFGSAGLGTKVASATGALTGVAIVGSVKLAAKGIRALTRDKAGYENEMRFYIQAISIGDYVIGGINSEGLLQRIKKNADEGNGLAQYLIGLAYSTGLGAEQSNEAAVRYFAMAADAGEKRSRSILAGEYLYGDSRYSIEEKKKGLTYLKELADGGDAAAMDDIIEVFATGKIEGIPVDANKVISLATEYGNMGNANACFILANIYDSAVNGDTFAFDSAEYKNDEKAVKVYDILLQQNENQYIEVAAMRLASMYKAGRGAEKDRNKELQYYDIASRYGNIDAKKMLIDAYVLGPETEKNYEKAKNLAKDLLNSGDKGAIADANFYSFRIADQEKKYKAAMDYARRYISSEMAEPGRKKEAQEYLTYQEELISKMSIDERCEYLGERKPLSVKTKRYFLIGIAIALLLTSILVIVQIDRNEEISDGSHSLKSTSRVTGGDKVFNLDGDGSIHISDGDMAVEYVKEVMGFQEGNTVDFENLNIVCDSISDDYYYVRIYNDMVDHISTIAYYGVTEEGYVYDVINDEWIIDDQN